HLERRSALPGPEARQVDLVDTHDAVLAGLDAEPLDDRRGRDHTLEELPPLALEPRVRARGQARERVGAVAEQPDVVALLRRAEPAPAAAALEPRDARMIERRHVAARRIQLVV